MRKFLHRGLVRFDVLFLISLCVSATSAAAPDQFDLVQRCADLPTPVAGGNLFELGDGQLLYAGGTTWRDGEKQWIDEAWRYDPEQDRWSPTTHRPTPFGMAAVAPIRPGVWLLVGGHGPEGIAGLTTGLTWTDNGINEAPLDPAPFTKAAAVSGLIGDTWVIVGGADDNDTYAAGRTTVWLGRVDPSGPSVRGWTQAEDFPGQGHAVAAGAVYGQRLYVFGGLFTDDDGAVRDSSQTWSYAPDTGWQQHAPLPVACRGATAVSVEGRGILIAGGWGAEGPLSQLLLFDPGRDTYTNLGQLPIPVAVAAGLSVHDGVYLAGNEDAARARGPQVFRIRLTPSDRQNHEQ